MNCYLTGVEITTENESLEHIFPNALGGQLRSKRVLCSIANQRLNKLIDQEFNKMFECIYKRLPLNKDRETKHGLKGVHEKYNSDIIFKDNRVFPIEPIYDNQNQVLYVNTIKDGQGYLNHLKKNNKIPNEQEVLLITDLGGHLKFSFSVNKVVLAKGLAKIAAGFATKNGIIRSHLKRIIDLDKKTFRDDISAFPYYPVQNNSLFELKAFESKCYPIHSLSLKGDKENRVLYCYVELFSTFQYIVILDDDYEGENLNQSYLYDLINGTEISLKDYIESINIPPEIKTMYKEHKNLEKKDIQEILKIIDFNHDSLEHYSYLKFKHLEDFITLRSLSDK